MTNFLSNKVLTDLISSLKVDWRRSSDKESFWEATTSDKEKSTYIVWSKTMALKVKNRGKIWVTELKRTWKKYWGREEEKGVVKLSPDFSSGGPSSKYCSKNLGTWRR